jgi:predicted phosphodiesterase
MARRRSLQEIIEEHAARNARPTNFISADFSHLDKATLVPFSDLHKGSPNFREELFMENLEWCWDKPDVVLILNGDLIEAATRYSVGSGVYEQRMTAGEQIDWAYSVFKPFAEEGRIIGTTNGNHEDRVFKETGVDVSAALAGMLGVPYYRNGGFVKMRVGSQNYHLYATHGSSGAREPTQKMLPLLKLSRFIDADVYLMGHVHEKAATAMECRYIDNRSGTVRTKERHFVLTGHYLGWENSYAQAQSMPPSKMGTPKVKLHGDEYMIRVSV